MPWSSAQWGVLAILAALVGFTWWIQNRPDQADAEAGRRRPGGFEARAIQVSQYVPGGAVQYRLTAARMQQYGGADYPTNLDRAVLEHYSAKAPLTHFSAPTAKWYEETNILLFPEQVTVKREAGAGYLPLWFEARQLRVDNGKRLAVGTGPVKARYGQSNLEAVGVEYDWVRRQLILKSKVRMVYAKPR